MHTYRKYCKLLIESGIGIQTSRQAIRILALLVKSGMVYILIGVSFALVYNHRLSQFLFFLQVTSVALIVLSMHFRLSMVLSLSMIVGIQLAVHNSF
jgi:hypothetical membrane protein